MQVHEILPDCTVVLSREKNILYRLPNGQHRRVNKGFNGFTDQDHEDIQCMSIKYFY